MSDLGQFMKANRGMIAVVACALVAGTGAGFWLSLPPSSAAGKPDQPIEWNQVQAVPTRAPDVEDNEWQGRVDAIDNEAAPVAQSTKNDTGPDRAVLENADQ